MTAMTALMADIVTGIVTECSDCYDHFDAGLVTGLITDGLQFKWDNFIKNCKKKFWKLRLTVFLKEIQK